MNLDSPKNNLKRDNYSYLSNYLLSGEDTQELVNFKQSKLGFKGKHRKLKSKRNNKNLLAYSMLDRSLENTLSLLESAKVKECNDLD